MCKHRRNIHVPVIVFGAKSAMNDKQDLLPNELLTSSAVLVVEIMRVLIVRFNEQFTVSTPFQVQFNSRDQFVVVRLLVSETTTHCNRMGSSCD